MKVRIGVSTGLDETEPEHLGLLVDDLQQLGFDSLWVPEILTAPVSDPLTVLAWTAARVDRLKLGTTMVLPGRNPVRLAKQLAGLDRLSGGRLLVTFVAGLPRPAELQALGVDAPARLAQIEELLPLVRRLWSEDAVNHEGPCWQLRDVTVQPRPRQQPLEVWLGGTARASLRRVGELSDGWLPSGCTPEQAAEGRQLVEQTAAEAHRSISPEHFGVSIGYFTDGLPPGFRGTTPGARRPLPPGAVPGTLVELRRLIERFVEAGMSKFVVRPLHPLGSAADRALHRRRLAEAVLPLQT